MPSKSEILYILRSFAAPSFETHEKNGFLKISTKADESYNDQMDVGTTDVTSGQKTSLLFFSLACLFF